LSVFVDANIPTYAGGRDHPLKEVSIEILDVIAAYPTAFVTDAEVLQELLHRYLAIRAWSLGEGVLHRFAALMRGRVEPMLAQDVEFAATLTSELPGLSDRDLIHLAVMRRLGVSRIVSADRGFDSVPEIEPPGPCAHRRMARERDCLNCADYCFRGQ
jgi:uncharacterized protein